MQSDNPQQFNSGNYILATLNKTYKKTQGKNNAFQTCQEHSVHWEISATEEKKNNKLNSTENLSNLEKEDNVLEKSNIASHKRVRLEGKFVCENIINFPR